MAATAAVRTDRFRVGTPSVVFGTQMVTDRRLSESFWVYQPTTDRQLAGGHETGRWYFRPVGNLSASPVTNGYPSPEAAIDALRTTQESKDSI